MNLEHCTKHGKIGLHEIYLVKEGESVLVCRNVSVQALKVFAGMKGTQVVLVNGIDHQWEMTPEEIREQSDYVAFWRVEPSVGELL